MPQDKIILISNGGLGDNLAFSTLPEELSKQKKVNIFIHSKSKFRNKEIYDLVWGCNPYIKGISNSIPNAGSEKLNLITYPKKYNIIQNVELLHNLKLKNQHPKIYYKPKKKKLEKVFLVDISGISLFYTNKEIIEVKKKIENLKKKFKNYYFFNVEFKNKITTEKKINFIDRAKFLIKTSFFDKKILAFGEFNKHFYYPQNLDGNIIVNSIFEYCDYICSSSGLISLHHGQSHLSSAIKYHFSCNLKLFCIMQKKIFSYHNNGNHGRYIFNNVNYLLI